MKILHFMTKETDVPKERILFMSAISGIANGLLLALINIAAQQVSDSSLEAHLLIIYILCFLLYIYAQRYAQRTAIAGVEAALMKVRLRIVNKVRKTELRFIEETGGITAYAPLTQGTNMISQSVMYLVVAAESVMIFVFAGLYLLWLSPPTFIVTIIILGLSIPYYARNWQKTDDELDKAGARESDFLAGFDALLSGFKEIKVNQKESDSVYKNLKKISKQAKKLKIRSNIRLVEDVLLSNVTFYFLLLIAVFILPQFVPEQSTTVLQVMATVLFLMGPVTMFTAAIPNISKTNVAIKSLYRLEKKLDDVTRQNDADSNIKPLTHFKKITLNNLGFHYLDKDKTPLFSSGPFNLEIKSGETIFIVGGNGSGKSTFLKLFTGLYRPDQGYINVDGTDITGKNSPAYRALFALVFTDFHLFDQLYGLEDISDDVVNHWLKKLELDKKTQCINKKFTVTSLSTGQKKRLAFIAAVLKNRPICIFDELAADQDPVFRKRFYQEILPELKAEGRTVIVVTHDEMYFDCCDRILKLCDGGII